MPAYLLVLLLLLTPAVLGRKRQTPQERFWEWFASRAADLEKVARTNPTYAVEKISAELAKADPHVVCEIGPVTDGLRELVLSADGISEHIPAVKALFKAAPPLPGWQVIAFRQRHDELPDIQIGPHHLSGEDVWFKAVRRAGLVDLELYLRGIERDEELAGISFILLDIVLGELDVMTKLGYIDHHPLPAHPEAAGLQPLRELPSVVDGKPN